MKPPRARFGVRRLMVAVAVMAAVLGVDQMRRRRDALLRIAAGHTDGSNRSRLMSDQQAAAAGVSLGKGDGRASFYWGYYAKRSRRYAEFQASLARRYVYLADHPWLSVGFDPPWIDDPPWAERIPSTETGGVSTTADGAAP